jgi:hypothetical protein
MVVMVVGLQDVGQFAEGNCVQVVDEGLVLF